MNSNVLQNGQKKEFKILCIDGGGIKGLYSATILDQFEKKFGGPLSDYFDMLCGTSTGGMIALAASLKISMSEVCSFYKNEGPKIFPRQNPFWISKLFRSRLGWRDIKQILFGGKFSDQPLKEALISIFGTKTLSESNNYLCIPTYTITEARPWVFKKDYGHFDRDDDAPYVDVALATSAAPTYFPLAEIERYSRKQFIDGGVWANNPSLVGLIEALEYFVGSEKEFDSIRLLSVSSLSITGGKPVGLKRARSFLDWRSDLFETSMTGQSYFADYFMSKIQRVSEVEVNYVRVPSAEISRKQERFIQLDVATPDALALISGKGEDVATIFKKKEEIAAFFKYKKISEIKHV